MTARIYARNLCELYDAYNRREYVHPDPLEFLYDYKELRDREIVGLIASSLAYGAVRQILKSVGSVLGRMDSPYLFLKGSSKESLRKTFKDFKHRFTTGDELSTMLYGIKETVERYGSLQECFAQGFSSGQETVIPALSSFVDELRLVFDGRPRSLLPSPDAGSACKRLNLFLEMSGIKKQ